MGQNFFYMLNKVKFFATMVAFALATVMANAQVIVVSNGDKTVEIQQNMSPEKVMEVLKAGTEVIYVINGQPFQNEGLIVYPVCKYWLENGKGKKDEKFTIISGVRRDEELREALHEQEVNTRMVESLYEDKKRDTRYYQVEGQRGVKPNDPNAGKIIAKSCNKYGWGFNVFGGYEYFKDVNSPIFGLGFEYTQPYWMLEVAAEGGWTEYSANAVRAGQKYFNYRTSAIAGLQPFKFDKYDLNRLSIVGGVKFKWFKTDSPKAEDGSLLNSEGNLLCPVVGLRYERRFFGTGNNIYVQVTAEQDRAIIQNKADDTSWGFVCKFGFNFGFGRNKVNNLEKFLNSKNMNYGYLSPMKPVDVNVRQIDWKTSISYAENWTTYAE
jgi:hypothetical protein